MDEKDIIIRAAEDQRIQEAQWIEDELVRQRKIEDGVRIQLQEEQRLLDEKKKSINENMERTLQLKRYNDEKRAAIESQAYGLYGITGDKLEGLDRYKNAVFKGTAAGFFLLTLGLCVLSGFLNGFDKDITLYLVGLMAAEGALLPRNNSNKGIYRAICSVMYFTLLPAAVFIFMTYELNYNNFDFVRPYIVMATIAFAAFGVVGYFIFNPYSKDRRNIKLAKKDLKIIKLDAAKNVKRNEKDRIKQEEEQRKLDAKEAARLEKEQAALLEKEKKEKEEAEKKAKKAAEEAERKAKKEAEEAEKKAKREAAKKEKEEAALTEKKPRLSLKKKTTKKDDSVADIAVLEDKKENVVEDNAKSEEATTENKQETKEEKEEVMKPHAI